MSSESVAHYSAAAPRPFRSFLNPLKMVRNLGSHCDLIRQLAHRDIVGRYRAAKLGLLWAILTPLFLLAIYTFVFSVVLGSRWNKDSHEGLGEFALYLFCGMLLFNLFAEVVTRAPNIVPANPNYVKKVVFPLEVLVVSATLTALFNLLIGFGVWLVFWLLLKQTLPPATICLLPLVVLPVCLTTMGIGWLVASLGVFIRDVGHAVLLIVQALFFATPVFYRISDVPERFRPVLQVNPLSWALEAARIVMIEGGSLQWSWTGAVRMTSNASVAVLDWRLWLIALLASAAMAVLGYAFFMKSKRAFADVI